MQKNVALPSKYLNGSDVGAQLFKLVIKSISMETMENDGASKPVMYFTEAVKGMVINSTNWDNMSMVFGDESDNWIGKQIEMYTEATRTPNGQPTRGVRIRPVAGPDTAAMYHAPLGAALPAPVPDNGQPAGPGEKAAVEARKAPGQSQTMVTDATDLDDEINF